MNDLKIALRTLGKRPGFTALVVVALGLGIGLTTTVFSVVNFIFLKPLPVKEPDQIVGIALGEGMLQMGSSLREEDFDAIRERSRDFEDLGAYLKGSVNFSRGEQSRSIMSERVTGNYFDLLGLSTAQGRMIAASDDAREAPPVAVISDRFWRHRLNSDPDVLGGVIRLGERDHTVVGVMKSEYSGFFPVMPTEVWTPLHNWRDPLPRGEMSEAGRKKFEDRQRSPWRGPVSIFGRLRPGADVDAAQLNLRAVLAQSPIGDENEDLRRSRLLLAKTARGVIPGGSRKMGWKIAVAFLGLTAMVLLVACANVTNLLLARAIERRKEIAIRLALGASRLALVRQLLIESLALALAAGVVGLLVAAWSQGMLFSIQSISEFVPVPIDFHPEIDWRVACFAMAVAGGTGLLFGLAPALQATGGDSLPALKDDNLASPTLGRLFGMKNLLLVGQLALCLTLLITAAMPVQSLLSGELAKVAPEFRKFAIAPLTPGQSVHLRADEDLRLFYRNLDERLGGLPGVEGLALSSIAPFNEGQYGGAPANFEDEEAGATTLSGVALPYVSPGYFELMGLPLLGGRNFTDRDVDGSQKVAIVNDAFAQKMWGEKDPLGRRVRVDNVSHEIVGVIRTEWDRMGSDEKLAMFFRPFEQRSQMGSQAFLMVRTAAAPEPLLKPVSAVILDLDINALNDGDVRTSAKQRELEAWPTMILAKLFGACGLIGLVLASVGIYGVVSYNVSQRTREIGIRMAIGAMKGNILTLVLRQIGILVCVGLLAGMALTWLIAMGFAAWFDSGDVKGLWTYSGVAIFLGAVAMASCLGPALKALRVDPMAALRHE